MIRHIFQLIRRLSEAGHTSAVSWGRNHVARVRSVGAALLVLMVLAGCATGNAAGPTVVLERGCGATTVRSQADSPNMNEPAGYRRCDSLISWNPCFSTSTQ
jgi:hypothetical protein